MNNISKKNEQYPTYSWLGESWLSLYELNFKLIQEFIWNIDLYKPLY